MRDAAEGGFDAAEDDGLRWLEGGADGVRVGDGGAVGAAGIRAAGGEVVLVAALAGGRVVRHHRVDAAGGDAPEEQGLAERAEGVRVMDVGLREEGDAEAVAHEDLSDDGDADVGVARDEDDVGRVPAARAHLLLGGGKKHGEDYTTKWALERAME